MSVYIVTGLSMSGKKTVLHGVCNAVRSSAYYLFIPLDTTKDVPHCVPELEQSVSSEHFHQRKETGQYLVEWNDKTNPKISYGLPSGWLHEFRSGRKVLFSLPFHLIPEVEKKLVLNYPVNVLILSTSMDVIQARIKAAVPLGTGGKETEQAKEEKKRRTKVLQESIESATAAGVSKLAVGALEKPPATEKGNKPGSASSHAPTAPPPPAPASSASSSTPSNPALPSPSVTSNHNDPNFIGSIVVNPVTNTEHHSVIYCLPTAPTPNDAISAVLAAFGFDPVAEKKRAETFDLQTCAPQDYLARTIFPTLAPLLELLDHVRPEDPVEFLSVQLLKETTSSQQRIQQLNEIHQVREQLRQKFQREYSVEGRV